MMSFTAPGAIPASLRTSSMPASTACSGAAIVVSTLHEVLPAGPSSTTSVKVPPISTAMRTSSAPGMATVIARARSYQPLAALQLLPSLFFQNCSEPVGRVPHVLVAQGQRADAEANGVGLAERT